MLKFLLLHALRRGYNIPYTLRGNFIDIYVRVSLVGHKLRTIYARKLTFVMVFIQTLTSNSKLDLPLGHAMGEVKGQNV